MVQRVIAGLGRRAAGDAQCPDRLDIAAPGLRLGGRLASLRGASRGERVNRVGLAVRAPPLTVGAGHLDDRHALGGQV
ncbi:MAG TPA: hypothetical protein VMU14_20650, partial [Acidimicrobiales bacterium]|nr:hypothetical protein [Acidimicrobiales bacterium]